MWRLGQIAKQNIWLQFLPLRTQASLSRIPSIYSSPGTLNHTSLLLLQVCVFNNVYLFLRFSSASISASSQASLSRIPSRLIAIPSFPSSFPHLFSTKDKLRCLVPCAIDQK